MNSINFVTGKSLDLEKQIARVRLMRIIAISSLLIVGFLAAFVFFITLLLPVSEVKKQQNDTILSISHLHKKLVTHVLVQNRLTQISNILNIRKDFPQISNSFIEKLPSDLNVKTFNINNGNLTLVIEGSLFSINQFINDSIKVSDRNNNIKNFKVISLSYSQALNQFDLTIQADVF